MDGSSNFISESAASLVAKGPTPPHERVSYSPRLGRLRQLGLLSAVSLLVAVGGPSELAVAQEAVSGLRFDGSAGYVTFGDPSDLDLAEFTIECWFRRQGSGQPTLSGGGGVTAVPLVTHGRGSQPAPDDVNYP